MRKLIGDCPKPQPTYVNFFFAKKAGVGTETALCTGLRRTLMPPCIIFKSFIIGKTFDIHLVQRWVIFFSQLKRLVWAILCLS